jgi:hypothetical protein
MTRLKLGLTELWRDVSLAPGYAASLSTSFHWREVGETAEATSSFAVGHGLRCELAINTSCPAMHLC